jgi:Flp pilus assembly pilin Flp
MLYVYLWLKNWLSEDEGQDIIEYVLIAGFIALAAVAGLTILSGSLTTGWNNLATAVGAAVAAAP